MSESDITKTQDELKLVKKRLRISEQDVFRLAVEKIALQEEIKNEKEMSKRCELQKEYYEEFGNYKGKGKYSDDYVKWLEDKILNQNKDDE